MSKRCMHMYARPAYLAVVRQWQQQKVAIRVMGEWCWSQASRERASGQPEGVLPQPVAFAIRGPRKGGPIDSPGGCVNRCVKGCEIRCVKGYKKGCVRVRENVMT